MSKYAVEFSHRANAQICKYFANSDSAEHIANWVLKTVDRLEEMAHQLADEPHIGTELPEKEYPFPQPGYRMLRESPFNFYYRVIDQTVFITHINMSGLLATTAWLRKKKSK